MFANCYKLVKQCQQCKFYASKKRNATLPLNPILVEEPFTQWGLDFIRIINPFSSASHKWILIATNYFSRWCEEVTLKEVIEWVVLNFLKDIITRFGALCIIISYNVKAFLSSKISKFALKMGFTWQLL